MVCCPFFSFDSSYTYSITTTSLVNSFSEILSDPVKIFFGSQQMSAVFCQVSIGYNAIHQFPDKVIPFPEYSIIAPASGFRNRPYIIAFSIIVILKVSVPCRYLPKVFDAEGCLNGPCPHHVKFQFLPFFCHVFLPLSTHSQLLAKSQLRKNMYEGYFTLPFPL